MAEITLVDKDGRTCVVGTPEEVNNLLCEGYRLQEPAPRATRPTSAPDLKAEK